MAKSKGRGRKKGSRNKGYFFRKGRGWFVKEGAKFIPLLDEAGERLRAEDTPLDDVKAAYSRYVLATGTSLVPAKSGSDATVWEVCQAYLDKAKEAKGENKTFRDRAEILFDFCFGLPKRFCSPNWQPKGKPTKADKIHEGYSRRMASELKKLDLDQWLQKHPSWDGGKRAKIKAVVRALNYGVECGLLEKNPVRGYKTPKPVGRITYITPEQEVALCNAASPSFAQALRVLIRTGMRPGCEFCKMTAKHVKDSGKRMEIVFQPAESKTGRLRTIYITDAATIGIIRDAITDNPSGPLFQSRRGSNWTAANLSKQFRRVRDKLAKKGIEFDADTCLYSTRHTFARRVLHGYWTNRPTNIETLARLMGNSPQICREHYLQWDILSTDFLWQSA